MLLIAWLLVLVPAAIALWCVAALLRAGRTVRLLMSAGIPAVAVAALFFIQYWNTRTPPAEPGWDMFYAIVSIVAGASTTIVTFPVCFLVEKSFDSRMR